jgi:hypothetical protein
MNREARFATLVRYCDQQRYTDVERIIQAWLVFEKSEAIPLRIHGLEKELSRDQQHILAIAAANELSKLDSDSLGICIETGVEVDFANYVPTEFIKALAKVR